MAIFRTLRSYSGEAVVGYGDRRESQPVYGGLRWTDGCRVLCSWRGGPFEGYVTLVVVYVRRCTGTYCIKLMTFTSVLRCEPAVKTGEMSISQCK
jgi:hypothetical protein